MRCACGFESDNPRLFLAGGTICKACRCHESRRSQGKERRLLAEARIDSAALQAAWLSPGRKPAPSAPEPISLATLLLGGKRK
jgi:hypothetical protein